MKKALSLCVLLVVILSCKKKPKENLEEKSLSSLFNMMQGSFNSEAQAKVDSSYYNISLHMYPIWEDKGNWLYVEQALNSMQDEPYDQRIYELKIHKDSLFASYIYTIPNDSLWIGKWKTPEDFANLMPSDLVLRKGCEVVLTQISDSIFKGETKDYACESNLRGANYATSEVEITSDKIVSWDRGFDMEGNHVWGAIRGGYIFEKLSN